MKAGDNWQSRTRHDPGQGWRPTSRSSRPVSRGCSSRPTGTDRRRCRPDHGKRPRHVVFTARGTSDHAALYGAYLTEIRLGIPAGLASPSAVTVYGARPDLSDAL